MFGQKCSKDQDFMRGVSQSVTRRKSGDGLVVKMGEKHIVYESA